jgi:hypothetical protein
MITNADGQSLLNTILCHSSGQWIESQSRIIPPKSDIQALFSYLTTLKRMAYSAICGVAVIHEDDDGEEAMASAQEIIAKGVSVSKYDPKTQSYETITKEQLMELEYELDGNADLAENVLDVLKIQSLADMPKNKYDFSVRQIRRIKHEAKNARK